MFKSPRPELKDEYSTAAAPKAPTRQLPVDPTHNVIQWMNGAEPPRATNCQRLTQLIPKPPEARLHYQLLYYYSMSLRKCSHALSYEY